MVEFFWVLLFGGALLLGYSSQKQNQQANEEVVADEIVDLPHDDLVTTMTYLLAVNERPRRSISVTMSMN